MFRHILLPIDGSGPAAKAARAGIALAAHVGGKVTVYYAVDPVPYGFSAKGAPADDPMLLKLERRALEAGEQSVKAIVKAAERAGVACQPVVEVARPDEGIITTARRRKCDSIFMATHGLRGFKRLLLGSVTSRVLANAAIPVVVYR
jgi:nucleotide-binding universal stress UspA family protein